MRELRTCGVTGQVVLVDRTHRDLRAPAAPPPEPCPWCGGLPGPVLGREEGWVAVPHPRPILRVEGSPSTRPHGGGTSQDALGAHEVLVGPHAGDDAAALRLARARILDLRGDRRLRGFRVVRRWRPGHHAVWHLWALPFAGAAGAPAAWRDGELLAGERVIDADDDAVAILAWAPRSPMETWVLPRAGRAGLTDGDPTAVARLGLRVTRRLSAALTGAAVDLQIADGEPWRLELVPRVGGASLYSTSTGIPHHGGVPELVADYLRSNPEIP